MQPEPANAPASPAAGHQSADISALTLDLDDTLWPVWPVIARAELVLHDWLADHAPATAQAFDAAGLRRLREQVVVLHPDRAHDLAAMRLECLRLALRHAGDDVALAEPASAVFHAARQRVDLFADVAPALDRLSRRYPILALTNGNADLGKTGIARWFVGAVSAAGCGVGKPDPRIFQAACRALGRAPPEVLHVGDDLAADVNGALAAGLHACWIRRHTGGNDSTEALAIEVPPGVAVVGDLAALADLLGC